MRLRLCAAVLSAALLCGFLAGQETVWIEGRVFDRDTKDPLPAFVMTPAGRGVSADAQGKFRIRVERPEAGSAVRLTVYLLGYKQREIEAKPGEPLEVALALEPLAAREVTVTADSVVSDGKGRTAVALKKMDVYRIPGAAADPLYASQVLPGVNSSPDASSLLIRGGAPDEVGYYFDGIEILHPFLSESLHESYFSIFDNQVVENFSVATSGMSPKYGNALSGTMDIAAKDFTAKGEGGVGLSVLGLNTYASLPVRGLGSFTASYDRGYSELLTRLNSRSGDGKFDTAQGFLKLNVRAGKSNQFRVYGLANDYGYSLPGDFDVASRNSTAALSWTSTPAANFVLKWLAAATRYRMSFDQPSALSVQNRDDIVQSRADFIWDLGRHYLEFGADIQRRTIATSVSDDASASEASYDVKGTRLGFYLDDKFRLTDRLYIHVGGRGIHLGLSDRGWAFDPRASAAFFLTKRDSLRFSAGLYHQFGDYFEVQRNPALGPKSAFHLALSYDRATDALEFRATIYDKEYRHLLVRDAAGLTAATGTGYARGAEAFLKLKNERYDALVVYNFLASKRAEGDVAVLSPSPYEIPHSATAIFSWKFKKGSVGLRYSYAQGRPFTPLEGRTWDEASGAYLPDWGAPMSGRSPSYQRLDLNGSWSVTVLKRMVVLYFGVTNLLDNANIARAEYLEDYSGRADRASIFGRSLFVGLYVPFF
jgi:hypothetical protein